jgi:hypothetical protein
MEIRTLSKFLSVLVFLSPALGAAADLLFPAELDAKAFVRSSDGSENEVLSSWGYFPVPAFPQGRSGKTGFLSKMVNPFDKALPGTTEALRQFIATMTSDGWVYVPKGKKIRIYYPSMEKRSTPLWDYPEGMTFIHRIWSNMNSQMKPFELRMLKKTGSSWAFATYIPDGDKLRFLHRPHESIYEIANTQVGYKIPLVRETYPRCFNCHSAIVGNQLYSDANGRRLKEELGPCEFLPGNKELKKFLLNRFRTHPSFFECAPGVVDKLCERKR